MNFVLWLLVTYLMRLAGRQLLPTRQNRGSARSVVPCAFDFPVPAGETRLRLLAIWPESWNERRTATSQAGGARLHKKLRGQRRHEGPPPFPNLLCILS